MRASGSRNGHWSDGEAAKSAGTDWTQRKRIANRNEISASGITCPK